MSDVCQFRLCYDWIPVVYDRNRPLAADIHGPHIYRFSLKTKDGNLKSIYIGQTQSIQRRMNDYRYEIRAVPKDQVNRIRNEFALIEKDGGSVELHVLQIQSGSLDQRGIDQSSLQFPQVRHIVENLLLCHPVSRGVNILNNNCPSIQDAIC